MNSGNQMNLAIYIQGTNLEGKMKRSEMKEHMEKGKLFVYYNNSNYARIKCEVLRLFKHSTWFVYGRHIFKTHQKNLDFAELVEGESTYKGNTNIFNMDEAERNNLMTELMQKYSQYVAENY